jgi:hypothetical protein
VSWKISRIIEKEKGLKRLFSFIENNKLYGIIKKERGFFYAKGTYQAD